MQSNRLISKKLDKINGKTKKVNCRRCCYNVVMKISNVIDRPFKVVMQLIIHAEHVVHSAWILF